MNIAFVYSGKKCAEPLALAAIGAVTPKDVSISVYHSKSFVDKGYDLVGMSVMTPTAIQLYELADKLRQNGNVVIMGGMHPTLMPTEASIHADSVVVGEAEEVWSNLLEDLSRGSLKKVYHGTQPELSTLNIPRHDLLTEFLSERVYRIEVARGCVRKCVYCGPSVFYRHNYRTRPINAIVSELENTEINDIMLIAENLACDPDFSETLFRAIAPLNKQWYGTIEASHCTELFLENASKSGCVGLFIGFDSLSQKNLDSAKSGKNIKDYISFVKTAHNLGINITGGFIFGFDDDDESTFENVERFVADSKIDNPTFTILTPIPGTLLFDRLSDRIITKDWRLYDFSHAVFTPNNFTAEELEQRVNTLKRKYIVGTNPFGKKCQKENYSSQ